MTDKDSLSLLCTAIGSLPHQNIDEAMSLVKDNFSDIPFWPQLSKLNKKENMLIQFLENMPAINNGQNEDKPVFDNENENFPFELEQLFTDWEEIIQNKNMNVLEKYTISNDYSGTFNYFLNHIKEEKPKYAKGQIIGPFTLSTTLNDISGKIAYYDITLREVITKVLSLKALWQIEQIKKFSPNTTPIIFLDEPSLSQLRTSAYVSISPEEPVEMIKEISDIIKENGGISAVHCCGRCDWGNLIKTNCNIINFDAYNHAEHFLLFSKQVTEFLKEGGKIAWGLIPTLNESALVNETVTSLKKCYDNITEKLSKSGCDIEFIKQNSLITPACGAAALTESLALKAMKLTKELAIAIKEG